MIRTQRKLILYLIIGIISAIIVAPTTNYLHTSTPQTVSASTQSMPMPLECFAVADSVDQLVRMDRFTGTFTDIGATGTSSIEAIAMSLDSNTLYAADAGQFGTLNMTTGVFTAIGAGIGTGNNTVLGAEPFNDVDSLSFDAATGILWGVVQTPNIIFAINPTTGTFIPNIFGAGNDYAELDMSTVPGNPPDTDDLGINPITGDFLVIANGLAPPAADRIVRVNIDPINPAASPGYNAATGLISTTDIAPLTNAGNPIRDMEGFSFFNDGSFYGTTGNASGGGNNDTLWAIDLTGTPGASTVVGAFTSYQDYESVGCLTAGSNTMSGTVFCEPVGSADGIFNAGDTAQNGAIVRLYRDNGTTPDQVDGSDTLIQSFTTGAGGTYNFELGIAGSFVLDIDPAIIPGGSVYTTPVTPGNDHDVDFVNTGPQFSEYGNSDNGNDFGFTCAALPQADLTVTKGDAPDPITPGNDLTYTIQVSNLGSNAATTATLSDPLPAGTTFVSHTPAAGWTCTTPAIGSGGTYNCSNPSVAVGGPYTFTLTVNVPPTYTTPNPIPNTATVGATNDSNAGNNTATANTSLSVPAGPDLTISKVDSNDPVQVGSTFSYTIVVSNIGSVAQTNSTVTDTLPAGISYISDNAGCTFVDPTLTCNLGTINPSGSASINITVSADTPGTVLNAASVAGGLAETNTANNTANEPTTIVTTSPPGNGGIILVFDPAISKIGVLEPGGLGLTGERITWIITITNIGTATGTNVIITDQMRPELRVDSLEIDDGLATIDGQSITFTIPSLEPGEVVEARIFTTVLRSPSDGMFDNTAILTAGGITLSATAVIPVPVGLPDTGYPPLNDK